MIKKTVLLYDDSLCEEENEIPIDAIRQVIDLEKMRALEIKCYGICTKKCDAYKDGECLLQATRAK